MVRELSERHPEYAAQIAACSPEARWIETISGPIPGARELVEELRAAGYHLYGLSNWSAETFPLARARFDVFDCFDDVLISGELDGIAKPDREMFDLLASRNGLSPSASVFIDDSPRNVEAAISYGYHGVHFTGTDALRDALAALGVRVGSARSEARR
jgi:2-haloacid dehalogenase